MRKKLIIITVLTTLILVGLVVVWKDNRSQTTDNSTTVIPPPELTEQQSAATDKEPAITTIKYGDSGFEPKEITIKKGTTVQFVNNTQIPMYVATDPHPEHTNYPELEMGVVLQRLPRPGENFSFKFDKIGNWTFHNHAQPEHTGTVIVE